MQHFASPLDGRRQTTRSLRASQHRRLHPKRKRGEDDNEPPISPDDGHSAGATPNPPPSAPSAPLTAAEAGQLRVAGLLPDDVLKLPQPPFPHRPPPSSSTSTPAQVQRELAALKPPLYAVAATRTAQVDGSDLQSTLRQTHLGNLTTVLHRCLLEGDYERAGRAWGMLLRSHAGGRPIDVRSHGRWAIGAEIHLQRHRIAKHSPPEHGDAASVQSPPEQPPASIEHDLFTEEGFRLARHYYELLILQYPTRKQHPHAVNQGHFYPAMFSLWIYEVSQQSKVARHRVRQAARRSESASRDFDVDVSDMEDTNIKDEDSDHENPRKQPPLSDEERQILNEELRRAREIAERLDQLLSAPPFDKRPDLLQLRGMVGLWIGDLLIAQDAPGTERIEEGSYDSDVSLDDINLHGNVADSAARLEDRQRTADRQSQMEDVQDYFRRATENGAVLWEGIKHLGSGADR